MDGPEENAEMWDSVALVCHTCKFVLHAGDILGSGEPRVVVAASGGPAAADPVATRALWKFLGQHVGHLVDMAGENSPVWEKVDIDFVQTGGDIEGDPTLAEYAADAWPGEALALRHRPVSAAVGEVVLRATDLADAHGWRPGEHDRAAARSLLQSMQAPPPAGTVVDDDAVTARTDTARGTLLDLRRTAALPLGETFGAFLRDCLAVLPAPSDLTAAGFLADSGPLVSPRLFDLERALRLIQGFLPGLTY